MIPGDLLMTRRGLQVDTRGITYLDVWESPETWANWAGKWEHHKMALLLEGRPVSEFGTLRMIRVRFLTF